jgi:hypothetical protein
MPKPTPFKIISDIVSKTTHPWEYEPDLYEWTHRGIECVARRNMQTGAWCGYVDVPREVWESFRILSVNGTDTLDDLINVHGGVTYSENSLDKDAFRIGFDCTHAGDKMPKMFNAETPMANKIFENDVYRDLAFVIAECESMVDQILKVTGGTSN